MLAKLNENMFDPHIIFVNAWFRSSQHFLQFLIIIFICFYLFPNQLEVSLEKYKAFFINYAHCTLKTNIILFQITVEVVPTVLDKLPLVTCAVVDACTTQLKPGEGGTVVSTRTSAVTLLSHLLLLQLSQLLLWLRVRILTYFCILMQGRTRVIIFSVFTLQNTCKIKTVGLRVTYFFSSYEPMIPS